MLDAAIVIFGLQIPVAVVAAGLAGSLGLLGSVIAAKIGKRKSRPEPMPSLTVGYAYPSNGSASPQTATKVLRRLFVSLMVFSVLILGVFFYVQPADGTGDSPAEVELLPKEASDGAGDKLVPSDCSRQDINYSAGNLIDKDPKTAWFAEADGDGKGKSATITFPSAVHLTKVGLIPGFARQRPWSKQHCLVSDAFPENRNIVSVRYTFDNGQSVVQHFQPVSDIQTRPVNISTTKVIITILDTRRPPRADNDTLISDTYFAGYVIN